MNTTKILFALLAVLVFAGGCCFVKCDCAEAGISVEYRRNGGDCGDFFAYGYTVTAFASTDDTHLGEEPFSDARSRECLVMLPPDISRYWVIRSDSLGISDTVRIHRLDMEDRSRRCCDCGPYINEISFEINGQFYQEARALRTY